MAGKGEALGTIDLTTASAVSVLPEEKGEPKSKHAFEILTTERRWQFWPDTAAAQRQWIVLVEAVHCVCGEGVGVSVVSVCVCVCVFVFFLEWSTVR